MSSVVTQVISGLKFETGARNARETRSPNYNKKPTTILKQSRYLSPDSNRT